MHKRNQSTRRPGNRGEARPASPALTRSRAAALGTVPPPPTEEADDQAAIIINPPEAGGGAATADSDGSLSTDGADSDAGSAIDADAAAADAAASRRRTEARLQQLEESQPALSPGHAASKITHSGDKLPAAAGRDAPRFIHDSTSYVTNTHTNHTIHACSLAAVRAATHAMRTYATTRATNHGLLLNSANTPGVVPSPTLHTVTHSHSNISSHHNISPPSSPHQ